MALFQDFRNWAQRNNVGGLVGQAFGNRPKPQPPRQGLYQQVRPVIQRTYEQVQPQIQQGVNNVRQDVQQFNQRVVQPTIKFAKPIIAQPRVELPRIANRVLNTEVKNPTLRRIGMSNPEKYLKPISRGLGLHLTSEQRRRNLIDSVGELPNAAKNLGLGMAKGLDSFAQGGKFVLNPINKAITGEDIDFKGITDIPKIKTAINNSSAKDRSMQSGAEWGVKTFPYLVTGNVASGSPLVTKSVSKFAGSGLKNAASRIAIKGAANAVPDLAIGQTIMYDPKNGSRLEQAGMDLAFGFGLPAASELYQAAKPGLKVAGKTIQNTKIPVGLSIEDISKNQPNKKVVQKSVGRVDVASSTNAAKNAIINENKYREWLNNQQEAVGEINKVISDSKSIANPQNRAKFLENAKREIDNKWIDIYSQEVKNGNKQSKLRMGVLQSARTAQGEGIYKSNPKAISNKGSDMGLEAISENIRRTGASKEQFLKELENLNNGNTNKKELLANFNDYLKRNNITAEDFYNKSFSQPSVGATNKVGKKMAQVQPNQTTIVPKKQNIRVAQEPSIPQSSLVQNADRLTSTTPSKNLKNADKGLLDQRGQIISEAQEQGQQQLTQKNLKTSKKSLSSSNIISQDTNNVDVVRKQVSETLQTKSDNLEKLVYGDNASELVGGTKGANKYQQIVRSGKEKYNNLIEKGLSSENNTARRVSRSIRALFGSSGNTAERTLRQGEMRGGIDQAKQLANDFQKMMDDIIPDKASKERVWAVLDPELSGGKIKESMLNASEKKALAAARQASDLINDINFSMGKISQETWEKGKNGNYITRAYEEYDLPVELSQAFDGGRGKLDLGSYKQRTEVNDWKVENSIKDPGYLMSKRIQSTFQNKAITDYSNWIVKQANMVSDTPRAGYTQLSDSKMWGDLAGKNVRHDVLEGIKGFYSDNKVLQGLYDALNTYDSWKPRQVLKKTKTVYNPATRLGNHTSNRVFAMIGGLNPITFEKNFEGFAIKELKNNGKYARLLRQKGILGTDMTRYELVKNLVDDGLDTSKIGRLDEYITKGYGAADDKAKLAAFKTWLDKGLSVDEAIIKVQNGFQDYSKVGLLYDLGAKIPIVGKPFIRFQSELTRIIKNSATENPLSLATVIGSIALIGNYASKLSGETPEDKKTREGRFGTPVIPYTQIPLVFQTPYGEVNVARMFGMYETSGADTVNKNLFQRTSKYLPFDVPTNKDDLLRTLSNDVLTGGVINQVTDTDFRGKSISDPSQSKYKPSTLTDLEKLKNRAYTAYRNYQMPIVNSVEDVGRAALGKKDQYGRERTVPQALSRLLGFKVEQFGPEQAQEQRVRDTEHESYKKADIDKLINSVMKEQAQGKIDSNTAQKRINEIQRKNKINTSSGQDGKIMSNPNGGFSYLDSSGSFRTVDTREKAEVELAKAEIKSKGGKKEIGDTIVYKSGDTVKATNKYKYYDDLYYQQMNSYKKSGDVKSWMDTASKKAENLQKMLSKDMDELDRTKMQNRLNTLLEQMGKYQSGFKRFSKSTTKTRKTRFAKAKAGRRVKFAKAKIKTPKIAKVPKYATPKIKLASTNTKPKKPKLA